MLTCEMTEGPTSSIVAQGVTQGYRLAHLAGSLCVCRHNISEMGGSGRIFSHACRMRKTRKWVEGVVGYFGLCICGWWIFTFSLRASNKKTV